MKTITRSALAGILLLAGGSRLEAQEGAGREPGERFRDCASCPEMVVVPEGSFTMGSPSSEEERQGDEGPQHLVTIGSPFAVGVYEVTFAEWDACVEAGGCGGFRPRDEVWGRGSRPVMNVSREDAQEYVRWLSGETGAQYRLLSEAEWEYVARAGTQTARYWGEGEREQCQYANGADATAHEAYPSAADSFFVGCSDGNVYTAPVGSFEPNRFGMYDMLGNVFEWTGDCWNGDHSGAPADGSARLQGDCSRIVVRGGSYDLRPRFLRSALRFGVPAGIRNKDLGFRVARTLD